MRVSSKSQQSWAQCIFFPAVKAFDYLYQALAGLVKKVLQPIAGYFLQTCVLRNAALKGRCSKWVIEPLARRILNIWLCLAKAPSRAEAFSKDRLQKSQVFIEQFGEIKTVQTEDGASIRFALFSPQKFDKWIEEHGGIRDGALIRPKTAEDWVTLQELRSFKCFKEEGETFKVPEKVKGASLVCVLKCQGFGRTTPMDKADIGRHLAAGFPFAVFDYREEDLNCKKLFTDAETAYQTLLKEGFTPQQIKPIGTCRATFVVARLKELHHHEGLDIVMVQAPSSLESVINQTPWPASSIGLLGMSSIETEGYDFDSLKRLKKLKKSSAATCLITSEGDATVPQDTIANFEKVLKKKGSFQIIFKKKDPLAGDPHFEDPFMDAQVQKEYFKFLTRNSH